MDTLSYFQHNKTIAMPTAVAVQPLMDTLSYMLNNIEEFEELLSQSNL